MRFFDVSMCALCAFALYACLPSHLKKYQEPVSNKDALQEPTTDIALVGKQGDETMVAEAKEAPKPAVVAPAVRPTIIAINKNTYQFSLPDDQVWDSLLAVLLKNYNLTLISREQGLVTTEWDSYQLGDLVYRNKVSARLQKAGRRGCELTVHNNVERLSDEQPQQNLWLPGDDGNDEGLRIVKNIAILLRQPPPQTTPPNIAKEVVPEDSELR